MVVKSRIYIQQYRGILYIILFYIEKNEKFKFNMYKINEK